MAVLKALFVNTMHIGQLRQFEVIALKSHFSQIVIMYIIYNTYIYKTIERFDHTPKLLFGSKLLAMTCYH
jgi:hypothetical protein